MVKVDVKALFIKQMRRMNSVFSLFLDKAHVNNSYKL